MAQLIVEPNMCLDEIQTLVWVSNLKGSLLKLIEDVGFSYKYLHKVVMSEKNECGEWVEQEGNASTMVTMDIGIRHRRPELPGKRLSGRLRAYHRSIVRKKQGDKVFENCCKETTPRGREVTRTSHSSHGHPDFPNGLKALETIFR